MTTALDPKTGSPVWVTRLGYNRYRRKGIGSGFYQETIVPFGYAGDQLVVLDNKGTMYLLNPDTGEQTNKMFLDTHHLQVPFAFRDQLVISGWKSIRSYNYRRLFDPKESDDAALAIREARCVLELGRSEESLALLDAVTTHAPNNAEGWAARAAVSRVAGGNEAGFSAVKALTLREQGSDPWAAKHDGLVKVIDVGAKPTFRWMKHQGKHYFGTFDGKIWECSPDDATAKVVKVLDRAISYSLYEHELASILTGKEVEPEQSSNPELPREWFSVGGVDRISSEVKFKGREFRSMRGGRTRMLDGMEMKDLDAKRDDVDLWSLHASQHAAFGYGNAIYRVDENCVPIEPITSLEIEGKWEKKADIGLLASDEKHICAAAGNDNGHILQILTHDGTLLNRHELCGIRAARHQESLVPLRGGFLHTDRRLAWITPQDGGRVWDFGPDGFRTSGPMVNDRVRYFSDPLISDNHLCVLTLEGQLLVFDIDAITSTGPQ